MNIGFWMCIILVPGFLATGLFFAVKKGKAAKYVSGFNSLSGKEQEMYDKEAIARDIRNSCFLWTAIMAAGALLSWFLTPYMAAAAYIAWGIFFLKEVHLDAHKAFETYRLKQDEKAGAGLKQ